MTRPDLNRDFVDMVRLEDETVPCIGLSDLIRNKRASGRQKDLVDLEILERQSD